MKYVKGVYRGVATLGRFIAWLKFSVVTVIVICLIIAAILLLTARSPDKPDKNALPRKTTGVIRKILAYLSIVCAVITLIMVGIFVTFVQKYTPAAAGIGLHSIAKVVQKSITVT